MRAFALMMLLLPALARAEEELPVYPGTVHTRIGGDLVLSGEHYRMAYFVTRDPLARVADYFLQQWRRRGYPTVVDGDLSREGVVSAFFTRQGLQRAVVLRSQGGKTLGFVVLKDLWRRAESPRPAPRLEGTLVSEDVLERGGSQRAVLLESDLPGARARVLEAFAKEGYRDVSPPSDGEGKRPGASLELQREGARVFVTLSQVAPGLVAVLQTAPAPRSAGETVP